MTVRNAFVKKMRIDPEAILNKVPLPENCLQHTEITERFRNYHYGRLFRAAWHGS